MDAPERVVERVFITGGSGFVGKALIRKLMADGARVTALARSDRAAAIVTSAGAVAHAGDLDTIAAMTEGMRGADTIFHAAALMDVYGPRERFAKVNVEGTRNVIAAMKASGAGRLVFLGSGGVTADGTGKIGGDESAPLQTSSVCGYSSTKAEAEQIVAGSGVESVIIRPTMVWGEGDDALAPALVEAARTDSWRWFAGGNYPWSTTHVDNVVAACMLAARVAHANGVYFVTDSDKITFRKFLTAYARAAGGVELTDKAIPRWAAQAMATVLEGVWSIFRLNGRPPLTRPMIWMMGHALQPTDKRARTDLGYVPLISRGDGLSRLAAARA